MLSDLLDLMTREVRERRIPWDLEMGHTEILEHLHWWSDGQNWGSSPDTHEGFDLRSSLHRTRP